ncbi:MAG: hypothetical protein ABI386_12210 [Rhodanobacter sp.]
MTTPLPPTDPSSTDDNLPGEAELVALYHQLPRSEPAPALDAAVLRAAALALDGTGDQAGNQQRQASRETGDHAQMRPASAVASMDPGTHARRRHVPRWVIGLASAASLVLVAGLAWHMRQMPAQALTSMPTSESVDAAQAMTGPTPPRKPVTSPTEPSNRVTSPPLPPATPSAPPQRANHLRPLPLPGLTAAAPGTTRSALAPYKLSDKAVQQDHAAAMNATRRAVLEKRAASAPKRPAQSEESAVMQAPSTVLEAAAPAPAAIALPEEGSTAVNRDDTPEQALAKIRTLLQEKHEGEARQRLQAFRRANPQWSIPEDLRGLLGEP